MKITRIRRTRDQHKKRVAAYCRVSTMLEEQEDSFEIQKAYYQNYIKGHDDWVFAGIYSDEKSGTKAENREGFQDMIKDAIDGKVDYILVKSISRFSRNIVDCQRYVKILHGNGVDVWFEKEHLSTSDPACSMMFSFLSAIAQDESRSISENVRWAYRERFKRGEYNLGNNRILGYDSVDGKLVPNKDADAVRLIYQLFMDGKNIEDIRRMLADYGVRSRKGDLISHKDIVYILKNETYKGDKLLQKQAPQDFLTKKPDKSQQYESFYLENDHEAIVEKDVWEAVQQKFQEKKEIERVVGHRGGQPHFLFGRFFCGQCGAPMTRRTLKNYDGTYYKAWTCRERHKGRKGNGCNCRNIREEELLTEICRQMGWEEVDEEHFTANVAQVLIEGDAVKVVKK